jgi:phospholipid N-methyltransferase
MRRAGRVLCAETALPQLMTQQISPSDAPVIVLGAGTGAFVRRIIGKGVPPEKIALIEYGSAFAEQLQKAYPAAKVLWMSASALGTVDLFGARKSGTVVSSLPLRFLPTLEIMQILSGAFGHLRRGGTFYQVSCGPRCPIPDAVLDRLQLEARRAGKALAAVPQATIYRIRRR